MEYKQVLFYFIAFILGLIIGKTVKLNIVKGRCPFSKNTYSNFKLTTNSESSEDYI